MSVKELLEAVQDIATPDFVIENRAGVFNIRPLTIPGRDFLLANIEHVSGSDLIGGLRFDRVSAVELIDGIFDAGLTCV